MLKEDELLSIASCLACFSIFFYDNFLLCLSSQWKSGEENVLLKDGAVSIESRKRVKVTAVAQTLDEYEERDLIRYYFFRGFKYCEIRNFLLEYHGKEMSTSTLKRRIKSYGLSRQNPDYDEQTVRNTIRNMIDGSRCLRGYGSVWHALQLCGMRVPRILVQQLLKEVDQEGTSMRKAHRLKRRTYHNLGTNYA